MANSRKPASGYRRKSPSSKPVLGSSTSEPTARDANVSAEPMSLSSILSKKPTFLRFRTWIVGDTPLISHAWSEKAKREMLSKQVKAIRAAKEAREPERDFVDSLYEIGVDDEDRKIYGFPVTAIKNGVVSAAHKDKGIPRTDVERALWFDAPMMQTRPALAGAVCNMPLLRIYGAQPVMREDMVRIGKGLNKTAQLAYRGQFFPWAFRITGRYNSSKLPTATLASLINDAGLECGVGEWRNDRKGNFGAYHISTAEEEAAWEAYAAGVGPLPTPRYDVAEAA